MIIAGLTGQTGAGKTTACLEFEKSGYKIINADKTARAVMEKASPCLNETVCCFGEKILNPDKTLDRKALANIVFSDKESLLRLDEISYKYINKEVMRKIKEYESENILIDAPTLFESGEDKLCNIIVSVISEEKLRLERIMKRDNISENLARKRMASQKSTDFFISNSDYIIENNGSHEELVKRTREVINLISERLK